MQAGTERERESSGEETRTTVATLLQLDDAIAIVIVVVVVQTATLLCFARKRRQLARQGRAAKLAGELACQLARRGRSDCAFRCGRRSVCLGGFIAGRLSASLLASWPLCQRAEALGADWTLLRRHLWTGNADGRSPDTNETNRNCERPLLSAAVAGERENNEPTVQSN